MSSTYAGDQAKYAGHRVEALNQTIIELNEKLELNNLLWMLNNGLISKEDVIATDVYIQTKEKIAKEKVKKR